MHMKEKPGRLWKKLKGNEIGMKVGTQPCGIARQFQKEEIRNSIDGKRAMCVFWGRRRSFNKGLRKVHGSLGFIALIKDRNAPKVFLQILLLCLVSEACA